MVRAIPLGRAGGRQQRMRVGSAGRVDPQAIAGDDACRWVQQDCVTRRLAFRMKGALDEKGPTVALARKHGAFAAALEGQ